MKIIYPEYEGRSLLNVSSTILSIFGVKTLVPLLPETFYSNAIGVNKVILFLMDGLGYNLYQKFGLNYAFFKNLKDKGIYESLTTVFPSTTAAALNSLYSGFPPAEHGLPEWYVYFPELDCVLESLPFRPIDPQDLVKTLNFRRDILFKDKTIFQYLKDVNIESFSLVPKELFGSLYTETSHSGSQIIGYEDLEDLARLLTDLSETSGKAFISVYYSSVDSAEHRFGVFSQEVKSELMKISDAMQDNFIEKVNLKAGEDIAVMLTADHGQITIDLKDTIYLDEIKGVVENLKIGPSGKVIPPTSGTRNAFLKVKEEKLDFVTGFLQKELKGKAIVMKMDEALDNGLFGKAKDVSRFLERTGNLLLIALSGYTLAYHYTKDFSLNLIGRHGSLGEDEMTIPFACARLSALKK